MALLVPSMATQKPLAFATNGYKKVSVVLPFLVCTVPYNLVMHVGTLDMSFYADECCFSQYML